MPAVGPELGVPPAVEVDVENPTIKSGARPGTVLSNVVPPSLLYNHQPVTLPPGPLVKLDPNVTTAYPSRPEAVLVWLKTPVETTKEALVTEFIVVVPLENAVTAVARKPLVPVAARKFVGISSIPLLVYQPALGSDSHWQRSSSLPACHSFWPDC